MAIEYNGNLVTNGLVCLIDPANPKSYSVNVHPKPLDLFRWVNSTSGSNCVLSRETNYTSPAGGYPLKMVQSGTDAYTPTYNTSTWNLAPAVQGETWTVSVWIMASAAVTIEGAWIGEANSTGVYLGGGGSPNVAVQPYTWTRISGTYTLTNASTAYVQTRLDGVNASANVTIWWDGLQLERNSSRSAFNPNTNLNGVTVNDISGNGYNFTMVNKPTYSSVNGGVLTTNGSSSYLFNSALNLSSGASTVFGAARYVTVGDGRMINGYNNNWLMGHWRNTTLNYYSAGWVTATGNGPGDTNWRTYAAVCDTVNTSGYALYANGQNVIGPATGGTQGPNGICIGRYNQSASEYANGQFGFLAVYNRQLTAEEIAQNHNAIKGRYSL